MISNNREIKGSKLTKNLKYHSEFKLARSKHNYNGTNMRLINKQISIKKSQT